MLITYRKASFGWYIHDWLLRSYNRSFGNLAWSDSLPSECCWIVPGTIQPDEGMVQEYCPALER